MDIANQPQAINTYQIVVDEIRGRLETIQFFLDTSLPDRLVQECCYLQFRMCCELVAIGCLVAHGDIKEVGSAEMQKAYQADKIMRALSGLHPDFYPIPCKQEIIRAGRNETRDGIEVYVPGEWKIHPYEGDYLTKDELLTLYYQAGSILHQGGMKKYLGRSRVGNPKAWDEIIDLHRRFIGLLGFHKILLIGGDQTIVGGLYNANNPGHAHASLWQGVRDLPEAEDGTDTGPNT